VSGEPGVGAQPAPRPKWTAPRILDLKRKGEVVTVLTAYDFPTARLADEAGIEILLVGDSVGTVVLGYESTLPVTMEDILHHTRAVVRAKPAALVVADMPFLSYQVSDEHAVRNAGRLIKEGRRRRGQARGRRARGRGACARMVDGGIPVMGHLGLTPAVGARVRRLHGAGARRGRPGALLREAKLLEKCGCFAIVLEGIPARLGAR
jgi:3-methyl-2-oxobutanoate hydroxymethyltransferase